MRVSVGMSHPYPFPALQCRVAASVSGPVLVCMRPVLPGYIERLTSPERSPPMASFTRARSRSRYAARLAPFGPLEIAWDPRILEPRPWTRAQSEWAASLLMSLPEGEVLELCAGAGHIGLLAVAHTERRLVCVDADPVACAYARLNAQTAGLAHRVRVRCGDVESAVAEDERFALVIADPPWVAFRDIGRFSADPPFAIDGGLEGLDVARKCLRIIAGHLLPGGTALLQVGPGSQADQIRHEVSPLGLVVTQVRHHGDRGALVRLDAQ
jgi:methylase of polypeptide subunit release factors